MLNLNLLATKLHCPPCPAKWVQRPFLTQRLHEGLELNRQLTLVSAPAGFGKTTCISAWLNTLDCPVAWLSLDAGDDDPGRFFAYFLAALQRIDARLGQEIRDVLNAGQLPPSEILSTTLSNNMLAISDRFLLVLDDFHVIQDKFIFQVLESLITNPPPPLHLVLVTREDPPLSLARLRANNQMTEIRARDLRFTSQDTAHFLEAQGLSLSSSDIASLEDKTEGWVVGLQLAAIALQSSPNIQDGRNPSEFISSLSGSHRFILSYLTEQVLDQQPEDVRQFLLQTAVLDKLHGDLCNAVTERLDGRALLERLFYANLFLIPLDDVGEWYRYHHLFAGLLRDRQRTLMDGEAAGLHQRASQWYAQKGMAAEAIQHALAAADYVLAVDLLETHAMHLIMQGYVKRVNDWVEAIPEQWQSQSPRTHLAFAWMHLLRGAYAQALPYLERLQKMLADTSEFQPGDSPNSLKADWLVMQSLVLYMRGQATESEIMAERALALASEPDDRIRSLAYYALASAYWLRGEYGRAAETYRQAIQYGRLADNHVAEIMSASSLALMAIELGQLHLAYEIALPIDERCEKSGALPPISALLFGALAEVCLQWNQLEQAQQYIQRSLHLSQLGGINTGVIFSHVLLSRLAQMRGDLATAAREIETAVALLPVELPDYIQQEVVAQQVKLYLACHRPAAAAMALQTQGFSFQNQFAYPELDAEQRLSHSLGLLYNSSLLFLLHSVGNGRYADKLNAGIELADRLIAASLQSQKIPVALETLLLRAQIHAALGDHEASQSDYARALELAEPEGFISIFIEQGPPVAEALAQLAGQRPFANTSLNFIERIYPTAIPKRNRQAAPLAEPLSERELDVLRLMADGLKYKEIAAELFISLNTVRYHVKALYGKLNVSNRTQAIETARQKEIL